MHTKPASLRGIALFSIAVMIAFIAIAIGKIQYAFMHDDLKSGAMLWALAPWPAAAFCLISLQRPHSAAWVGSAACVLSIVVWGMSNYAGGSLLIATHRIAGIAFWVSLLLLAGQAYRIARRSLLPDPAPAGSAEETVLGPAYDAEAA